MASFMPWMIFLSAGQIVASTPPSSARAASAVAGNEVVRTEPHAPFHRHKLVALEVKPLRLDQARLVITLQHPRRALVIRDRLIHRRRPIGVREVAAEIDAARAPGVSREAGHLQDQLALLLGQRLELAPVGQVQLRDGGVRGQGSGIDDPGVGHQAAATGWKKLSPSSCRQKPCRFRFHSSAKSIFSSKIGLGGGVRRIRLAAARSRMALRVRHVGQVEQLEEAIDGVPVGEPARTSHPEP